MNKYQPVIGLEVHVELKTKSKMFCGCSADYFGKEPNTHVCPVCLGLPGALPVPNKTAIEWCVMIGLALNCEIPLFSKFDRKNYFYPDLPKGYQISQYDQPFAINGSLKLEDKQSSSSIKLKVVRIRRVHMEEDTGKLIHSTVDGEKVTLIDFNRSGVPLVEIVTEPDFKSADEVVEYLKKLQQIVRYLGVSNADMEKGDMRLEPNISLAPRISNFQFPISNEKLPKYKVEIKNINSFRFVEKAILYEISRQTDLLESGEKPVQETRGWDENKQKTVTQRVKEEAHDYRYFPEPDIPPIRWEKSQIANLKSQIPELPNDKQKRFVKQYGLRDDQAFQLIATREKADFFEEAVKDGAKYEVGTVEIANVIINKKINWQEMLPAALLQLIIKGRKKGVPDNILKEAVQKVVKENPKAVSEYKSGKIQVLGFLTGQVVKLVPEAPAREIQEALEKKLKK